MIAWWMVVPIYFMGLGLGFYTGRMYGMNAMIERFEEMLRPLKELMDERKK